MDALNTLVRALIAESNLPEARKTLDRGNALPAQDQAIRLAFATTGARLVALEGQQTPAVQSLDNIIQKTKEMKLKKLEFEARFVKASIEVRLAKAAIDWDSGRKSSAQADLKSLQTDASAAGFRLIARKAGELAKAAKATSS
jgi:hypothetical protein